MYEGDEINSDGSGSFDRPGAIVSSSPDEQQNAAPVKTPKAPKPPKPSKVEEPAPMFFQEPVIAPATPVRERTKTKTPLFIGLGAAILVVIVVVAVVIIINSKGGGVVDDPKVAGRANISGLFDKTAPIPYRTTKIAKYGYVDPSSQQWVIAREYDQVSPFYGEYALVRQYDQDVIINRKGEVVIRPENGEPIYYDIDENVWTVGHDVYNGNLKKANPKESTATYLSYGYASVIPDNKETDDKSVFANGIPYIIKVDDGKKIYKCEKVGCSFLISLGRTDEKVYSLVHYYLGDTKIIRLEDGAELYSTSNNITKVSNGIFEEVDKKTKKTVKYITVDNGEMQTSNSKSENGYRPSISHSAKYYKKTCDGSYAIEDNTGKEILPCGISKMWELSKNSYTKLEREGKEVILIQKEDGVHLYNMKEGKDIKVYEGAGDVVVFENSAFIEMTTGKNKKQICNVFEPDMDCVRIKKDPTHVSPTSFAADNKIYTYELKVVKNED